MKITDCESLCHKGLQISFLNGGDGWTIRFLPIAMVALQVNQNKKMNSHVKIRIMAMIK
jgi:hypothetical protein